MVLHLINLRLMQKYRKLHIIIIGCFLLLLFRFYYFQVHEYSKYETKAGHNSLRKISLHAPRGIIYDRHGIPLVDNRQIYDLSVIPFDVTDQFNYSLLASLTGWSPTKLKKDIADRKKSFHRFRTYTIERHLNFKTRSDPVYYVKRTSGWNIRFGDKDLNDANTSAFSLVKVPN